MPDAPIGTADRQVDHVCECDTDARSLYRVTAHDGSVSRCMYCAACAELAADDWNGETAAIEPIGAAGEPPSDVAAGAPGSPRPQGRQVFDPVLVDMVPAALHADLTPSWGVLQVAWDIHDLDLEVGAARRAARLYYLAAVLPEVPAGRLLDAMDAAGSVDELVEILGVVV